MVMVVGPGPGGGEKFSCSGFAGLSVYFVTAWERESGLEWMDGMDTLFTLGFVE